jgi:hypothetical protein
MYGAARLDFGYNSESVWLSFYAHIVALTILIVLLRQISYIPLYIENEIIQYHQKSPIPHYHICKVLILLFPPLPVPIETLYERHVRNG